ncbi:lysophospholipase L1-like esterase [Nakamurella sp. UYEF19]|uniref:GDSL-type esterase/lipase family protein n=1 Tax=Nakamurella sp. UYEF19 TaxID=1756392 RepID=UPI0033989B68
MTLSFAVLGDSIAYGQGSSRPADTVGARLTAELIASGRPTELRVFAVPRACSDALSGQVRQATDWGADLALVVIGANDLTHFVPTGQAAAALGAAVRALRAAGVRVVVSPAPDLSVVPWVPPQMRILVSSASDQLRRAQTRAAQTEGARVADLDGATSAAFAADLDLFSADRFHPSSAGYGLIAAALAPAILATAAEVSSAR